MDGFAVKTKTKEIYIQTHKYALNLIENPALIIFLLIGIVLVLYGFYTALFTKKEKAFWFTASGTVITVMSIFFMAGFNHTAFYPSTFDIQSSLTLANSASSKFTLVVMSYVSLMVPIVLTYIV